MNSLVLFDGYSVSLDSPLFSLGQQVTIVASGMDDDDFITFEIITLTPGARARICGCQFILATQASILAVEQLMCPSEQPLQLSARSPVLVLDYPQGSILRAHYNGTALDNGTVFVMVTETNTLGISDAMRGCPDGAVHVMPTIQVDPSELDEGDTVCWTVFLEEPVEGSPIYLIGRLTGTEQTENSYPYPTATIYPGQSNTQLCVATVDNVSTTDNQLCLELMPNTRFEEMPPPLCATVLGSGVVARSTHAVVSVVPAVNPIIEGDQACWLVTLDAPVVGADLVIDFTLGGTEQIDKGYVYPSLTIPVGATSGTVCVTTIDDGTLEATKTLCLRPVLSTRITARPGTSCLNVNDNDAVAPGDSIHTIVSVAANVTPITEGDNACWHVTLNGPVTGTDLLIGFALSGGEQTINNYAAPTLTIPVGASAGDVCVATIDDGVYEGAHGLCLRANLSSRVTARPATVCLTVNDNDGAGGSTHSVISVTVLPTSANEGQTFCWTVTLDAPVSGAALTVYGVLSGSDQDANSYPSPSVVIPIGQSSGDLCVLTNNNSAVDGDLQLCLVVLTSARVTTVPAAVCATVLDLAVPTFPAMPIGGYCCNVNGPKGIVTVTANLQFLPAGIIRENLSCLTQHISGYWVAGSFDPSDYEVEYVPDLGSHTSNGTGGAGNWYNLGSPRIFLFSRTALVAAGRTQSWNIVGSVRIRRVSDFAVVSSATLDFILKVNQSCP